MIIDDRKENKGDRQLPVKDTSVKLAGQDKDPEVQHGVKPQEKQVNGDGPLNSPGNDKMLRAELDWTVPMCVHLPIEILNPDQVFPFLNTTLADLGIEESAVKERVVWVDTKRTQEKEVSRSTQESVSVRRFSTAQSPTPIAPSVEAGWTLSHGDTHSQVGI
ncbi:hypothetical protein M9458_048383 [Cirrhinus mrigala]|uniref:Uncharacterized protein n=1 Tax=Cirrhinus mrigala TaxID=683832 RepID=A0ABD0N7F3_CIRMR